MTKGKVLFIIAVIAIWFWYMNNEDEKYKQTGYQYTTEKAGENGGYIPPYSTGSSGYTPKQKTCTSCYGDKKCIGCDGTGKVNNDSRIFGNRCGVCSGSGKCVTCQGKGYYLM